MLCCCDAGGGVGVSGSGSGSGGGSRVGGVLVATVMRGASHGISLACCIAAP